VTMISEPSSSRQGLGAQVGYGHVPEVSYLRAKLRTKRMVLLLMTIDEHCSISREELLLLVLLLPPLMCLTYCQETKSARANFRVSGLSEFDFSQLEILVCDSSILLRSLYSDDQGLAFSSTSPSPSFIGNWISQNA